MGLCISRPPAFCLASGPSSGPQLPVLAPNLYLPANLYLPTLTKTLHLPALVPKLYLPTLTPAMAPSFLLFVQVKILRLLPQPLVLSLPLQLPLPLLLQLLLLLPLPLLLLLNWIELNWLILFYFGTVH